MVTGGSLKKAQETQRAMTTKIHRSREVMEDHQRPVIPELRRGSRIRPRNEQLLQRLILQPSPNSSPRYPQNYP